MDHDADRRGTPIEPDWLDRFPAQDGIALISANRSYAHAESDYDNQYRNEDTHTSGQGIVNVLRRFDCDLSGPILELGCGTGVATVGLCKSAEHPWCLITDSSTAFLNIVKRKMDRLGMQLDRVRFAVLSDADLDRLPAESVSAIALRSVLHHFLDVPGWLKSAARVLRPGGAIVCEEPCASGYLNIGLIAQSVVNDKANKLTAAQRAKAQHLADTMKAYHRRDVDKTDWEDKHLFRPEEVSDWAKATGLESTFLPNVSFESCAVGRAEDQPSTEFSGFLRAYLQYCMNFGEKDATRIWQAAAPLSDWVIDACSGMREPHLMGIFVLRKPAVPES